MPALTTVDRAHLGHVRRLIASWARDDKFNPYHDPATGRFTTGPGGGVPPKARANLAKVPRTMGEPDADGSLAHPVYCDGDLDKAVRLIAKHKHVRLDQPSQVSTLVAKLGAMAQDAEAHGKRAKTYDLGLVCVPGTNLFTQESRGIKRCEMPQLQGRAKPGSPASAPQYQIAGEANVVAPFIRELEHLHYSTNLRTVSAAQLRATQMDLDGPKVAALMGHIDRGTFRDDPIFVTRDGYIVDGHHRWAAKVAVDLRDNMPGDILMPVRLVDMDIGSMLDLTRSFQHDMGIRTERVGRRKYADDAFDALLKQNDPLEGIYDGARSRERLLDLLAGRYEAMLRAVNALLERAVALAPGGMRLDDAAVRRFILTEAATRVVRIDATTQTALRVLIARGQQLGLSSWEIANGTADGSFPGIEGLFAETWRSRHVTIARTELQQAQIAAAMERFISSGFVREVEARDGGTMDSDDFCNSRNGRRYALNNPPQLAHPNCLVAASLVRTPDGSLPTAASIREFEGEVVVLRTASDQKLTCTPNHPILTRQGWVPAGTLKQGDHVVGCTWTEWRKRLGPDNHQIPAVIEQIADSLLGTASGATASVPCSAEDFHGDGFDGDVDVVWTNRFGKSRLQLTQPLGHPSVAERSVGLRPFLAPRAPFKVFRGASHTPNSLMSSGSLVSALPRAELGLSQSGGFGHRSSPPVGSHPFGDRGLVDTDELTDLTDAELLPDVELVEVRRLPFRGHVYNVQTDQGWYIADGVIVSNCTLVVVPVVDPTMVPPLRRGRRALRGRPALAEKFNPYHDPGTGRFATGPGGSAGGASGGAAASADDEWARLQAEDAAVRAQKLERLNAMTAKTPVREQAHALEAVLNHSLGDAPPATVNFDGLNPAETVVVAKTVAELHQKWPVATEDLYIGHINENDRIHLRSLGYDPNRIQAFTYQSDSGPRLVFNVGYRQGANPTASAIARKSDKIGFLVHTSNPPKAVVVHEFGHILRGVAGGEEGLDPKIERLLHPKSARTLSRYATTNEDEAYAEAFTAHYFGSSHPAARAVGHQVDAYQAAYA